MPLTRGAKNGQQGVSGSDSSQSSAKIFYMLGMCPFDRRQKKIMNGYLIGWMPICFVHGKGSIDGP